MRSAQGLIPAVIVAAMMIGCAGPSGSPGGPSAQSGSAPSGPKVVNAVMRGNPYTLSQAINSAGSGSVPGVDELQELIHAGLAVENDRRALRPRLAEELPSIENQLWTVQPDGRMETTWHLRKGVLWHDGQPFTSDDLAFSVRVAQDPQVGLAGLNAFRLIDRVDTPDPLTFTVAWSKPYIKADTLFTRTAGSTVLPMPRHLLEGAYNDDPAGFTQLSFWTHDYVGLGPFRVHEFVENAHMLLDANDRYFLGRPKIDQIDISFMPDPSTIAANLLAGAVDLTLGGRFSLEWGVQIRDQWTDGHMEAPVGTTWVALFPQLLNPTPAVLSEVTMRRALLLAINRKEMSDTIQQGLSPVADSLISPSDPEYGAVENSIVRYDFDPRTAAQRIEELGYAKRPDGVYADTSGTPLKIEIRTRQGDDLQEKTLFGVTEYWKQLGIAADPVTFPPQRAPDREYRATRPAFEVVRQPSGADAVTRYYGRDTPVPGNDFRGLNRTRYQNPELDALIDQFVTTIPKEPRNAALAEIIHHMTSNVVVLGIYFALDPTMISNKLVNVAGLNPTWNADQWDLKV